MYVAIDKSYSKLNRIDKSKGHLTPHNCDNCPKNLIGISLVFRIMSRYTRQHQLQLPIAW